MVKLIIAVTQQVFGMPKMGIKKMAVKRAPKQEPNKSMP